MNPCENKVISNLALKTPLPRLDEILSREWLVGFLRISKTFLMFVILCFAESALADVQDALANLIDENLRTCVAEQIDINLQASEITKIKCDERDIADLSGLSAFKG